MLTAFKSTFLKALLLLNALALPAHTVINHAGLVILLCEEADAEVSTAALTLAETLETRLGFPVELWLCDQVPSNRLPHAPRLFLSALQKGELNRQDLQDEHDSAPSALRRSPSFVGQARGLCPQKSCKSCKSCLNKSGNLSPIKTGGFIFSASNNVISIQADSSTGIANGVYWMMETFGGIRWFWATDLGTVIPEKQLWAIPSGDRVEEPGYISRQLSGVDGLMNRKLRSNRTLNYNHNLRNVFDSEIFEENPEWRPVWRSDDRSFFTRAAPRNFQPDLALPEVAKFAADVAKDFFAENPEEPSFSLAMNDNVLYGESQEVIELISPRRFFRGRPDFSDLIFTFMNRAAQALEDTEFSDRYLGALAYFWAENIPSFPVHPKVMPIVTADRSQWRDPEFKKEDINLTRQWAKAGPELFGHWDYFFSHPYTFPKPDIEFLSESIKVSYDSGVRFSHIQLSPTYGLDGPKTWLAANLLWDPTLCTEALLDEFYETFFESAGPAMRDFYDYAESIWMRQTGPAAWLRFYMDEAHIELVSREDLVILRSYLNQAFHAAESPVVRQRVAVASDQFRSTELYHAFHDYRINLTEPKEIETKADLVLSLETLSSYLREKTAYENHIRQLVDSHPIHQRMDHFLSRVNQSDAFSHAWVRAWKAADAVEQTSLFSRWLEGMVRLARDLEVDIPSTLIHLQSQPQGRELLVNSNLSAPLASRGFKDLKPWDVQVPEGFFHHTWEYKGYSYSWHEDYGKDGKGILLRNQDHFALVQRVLVEPGRDYWFSALAKGQVGQDNRTYFRVSWRDARGQIVGREHRLRIPSGSTDGWQAWNKVLTAPKGARIAVVSAVTSRQQPDDFFQIDSLSFKEMGNRQD